MLPPTPRHVGANTPDRFTERILLQTERNVARCATGGRAAMERRLAELERELDIERVLEAKAASALLLGLALAAGRHRRWLLLPAAVAGFLLQHALQGWCPPLPLLRGLGFRTAAEIDYERYALKVLRGDFENLAHGMGSDRAPVSRVLHAVDH